MHHLHPAAISESMRLYPPVYIGTKACRDDDILPDGTSVRKGWIVSYNRCANGRMESLWAGDCRLRGGSMTTGHAGWRGRSSTGGVPYWGKDVPREGHGVHPDEVGCGGAEEVRDRHA